MKFKHNKRRNTAFLYEILVRELVKSAMKKDEGRKKTTIDVMKRFFNADAPLGKELKVYKALYETTNLSAIDAERLLIEAKRTFFGTGFVTPEQVYDEQSQLIATINKKLSPSVFTNFVPNYKSLATIQQVFSKDVSIPNRIMLERKILDDLSAKKLIVEKKEDKVKINDLAIKTAVKIFNKKYENLSENQKILISKFLVKNEETEADLKLFVAEELSRIKNKLSSSLTIKEFQEDAIMKNKAQKTLLLIEEVLKNEIGEEEASLILKLQELEKELG